MVIKGRKLIGLMAMIAVAGTVLLNSTTPVLAGSNYSRNAQALSFHPRANDVLSSLAGAVTGGAVAGYVGGALGGAIGGAVGIAVAAGGPYAYSAGTWAYSVLGFDAFYGGPIIVEALIPSTALDS